MVREEPRIKASYGALGLVQVLTLSCLDSYNSYSILYAEAAGLGGGLRLKHSKD